MRVLIGSESSRAINYDTHLIRIIITTGTKMPACALSFNIVYKGLGSQPS